MDDSVIQELRFNDKWLSNEYKNSKYYRDYLDIINNELKTKTFIQNDQ